MLNIGILISGRGSNLQALIDASEKAVIPAKIKVVISDKPDAFGLERAKNHNIDTIYVDPRHFKDKNTYEYEIVKALIKHEVGLVCLAGYMRIVGQVLLEHYQGKMINIHPSLLPSFPGLHGQKQESAMCLGDYADTTASSIGQYPGHSCLRTWVQVNLGLLQVD